MHTITFTYEFSGTRGQTLQTARLSAQDMPEYVDLPVVGVASFFLAWGVCRAIRLLTAALCRILVFVFGPARRTPDPGEGAWTTRAGNAP